MVNLKRGFRRLVLVLSGAWVIASSLYLWPPPAPVYLSTDPNFGGATAVSRPPPPPGYSDPSVLADRIRTLYPEYNDLSDIEVERRLRAKSPELLKAIEALPDGYRIVSVPDKKDQPTGEQDLSGLRATERAAQHRREQFRSLLLLALLPPLAAFASLEALLWTARGFLERDLERDSTSVKDSEARS